MGRWERLRPRSVYDVMAAIACFGVLAGGTAYAANTIGSADVIDESLISADVKNDSLTPFDIQPESLSSGRIFGLNGADVDDDGLRGADILEASLGPVPRVATGAVDTAALANHSVTREKLAPEEGWHFIGRTGEPAFANGWTNYESTSAGVWKQAAYRKDRSGIVHLTGLVKGGTINRPMFNLPGTYCPRHYRTMAGVSANAFAQLTVTYASTNGCAVFAERGSNAWVSLDGLSFPDWDGDTALARPPGQR